MQRLNLFFLRAGHNVTWPQINLRRQAIQWSFRQILENFDLPLRRWSLKERYLLYNTYINSLIRLWFLMFFFWYSESESLDIERFSDMLKPKNKKSHERGSFYDYLVLRPDNFPKELLGGLELIILYVLDSYFKLLFWSYAAISQILQENGLWRELNGLKTQVTDIVVFVISFNNILHIKKLYVLFF